MSEVTLNLDKQFFERVLNESANVVFVKDKDFRIIYANQAFLNLYPEDMRDSIVGTTTLESFPPEEAEGFLAEDRRALEGETTQILEDISTPCGQPRTLLTRKIGFTNDDGEPMLLGISSDVTQMVQKERELVKANHMLQHFAALAAHDLRTPLHQFVSCLELLRIDKGNTFSQESEKYMDMMLSSANNLAHQISSLLMVYKPNSETQWSPTDLNLLMSEVRFNLTHEIELSGAKVMNDMLPTLNVNPHLFRQLLQNLIENSIKYKSEKLPLIRVKASEGANGVEFSVEDNGKGISKDSSAFKLFAQENTESSGAGIGLALCRSIVERHKGRIWVDEGCSSGACIRFFIPHAD